MSKHTPGKWKAERADCWNSWEIFTDSGENICIINNEQLAQADNARLIAAAPELLDALKSLIDGYIELVNSGDCGNWDPETDKEVIQARAAIAKAESI